MRLVSNAAQWFIPRAWGWITFRPGSRPRRTARKLVMAAVLFVLNRPPLARILNPLLEHLPKLKRRILIHLPVERVPDLFVKSALSLEVLSSERERFVHARLKAALEKRLS